MYIRKQVMSKHFLENMIHFLLAFVVAYLMMITNLIYHYIMTSASLALVFGISSQSADDLVSSSSLFSTMMAPSEPNVISPERK